MNQVMKLSVLYSVTDRLTGPVKQMFQSVSTLENTLKSADGAIKFGQRLGLSAAVVQESADRMMAKVQSLVGPISEIEDAAAKAGTVVISTMGSTQKSMEATTRAAMEWSKAHTDTAAQFLETSYMMSSAGLNDVQAIAGTTAALRVAKATFGEGTQAASLLATVYNNLGDKSKDATAEFGRIGDVITRTQQAFQISNLDQLAQGLQFGIPAAMQYRTSLEELNVVIGNLNSAGLTGGMAGSAYAATMRQLIPASRALGFEIARDAQGGVSLVGTLANIRKQFGPMAQMSDATRLAFQRAFGEEGIRAVSLLMDKTAAMDRQMGDLTNSVGAAAKAQASIENTGSQQLQIFENNVTAFKASLGADVIPVLASAADFGRRFFDSLANFAKAHPTLSKTAVMLFLIGAATLAIVAPILSVVAGVSLMTGYGLNGIGQLGKGFLQLKKILTSARFKTLVADSLEGLQSGAAWIGKNLSLAGASVKQFGVSLLGMAKQGAASVARAMPQLIARFIAFNATLWASPITWIVAGVIALAAVGILLARNWDKVTAALARVWGWLKNIGSAIGSSVMGWVQQVLGFLGSLGERFLAAGKALWNAFTSGLKAAVLAPFNVVKGALEKLRKLLPFSDAKEGPLSKLTLSGRRMMQTIQVGVQDAAPTLRQAVQGALAVTLPGAAAMPIPALAPAGAPAMAMRLPAPAPERPRPQGRQFTINGGLHLHVQKVDSPEDVYEVLGRVARELDGGQP